MKIEDAELLIWDVDGVLIHVKESYRKTIAETVQHYFSRLMGLELEERLMSNADTQKFKLIEGFNDDWKVAYACVLCFLAKLVSGIKRENLPLAYSKEGGMEAEIKILKELGEAVRDKAELKLDLDHVTGLIRASGTGMDAVEKALSGLYGDVEGAKRFWFPDVIKRVFQEIYLGEDIFREKYGYGPVYVKGGGLMRNEKALVEKETLENLSERFYMGIASGRERFEIETSLKAHGFEEFIPFDLIVSAEETVRGKPDPESLLECRKRMVEKYGLDEGVKAVYVGDSIDDVAAAKSANFYSVGCLSATFGFEDREALKNAFKRLGCDIVIDDANKLSYMI
ncbi:MAG: HAD-IA family hydrolase [Candidatus Altiarchaeota archaeon]|nr:HAD-IA family hydrolase [Candidatus Altiarchaeota archaeon]